MRDCLMPFVNGLFTESTYIVREGDPVDEMLFILRVWWKEWVFQPQFAERRRFLWRGTSNLGC
ncbi:cyclic nucleotide-gated ion channel 5-like protein [Gossypium australe]|uniref:Cyclic nucleotide-gated ion channel 5-like protein n=1 Tax=Gossypium australe TaxID=47621 RepID=A0A5B6VDA9_9ROSI|nr:cyclic nucleotide-gated ion channel 5-like protein [Gossypium australe]